MIEWNQIDVRLSGIGKDRTWLAEETRYSADTIRTALAPNSTKRSERMLSVLSRAIEDEEERQAGSAKDREIRESRPGVFELFRNDDELHRTDLASRIAGAPSVAHYCHDVVMRETDRILEEERRRAQTKPAYPSDVAPGLKVATVDPTGSSEPPNPVESAPTDTIEPFPDAGPASGGSSSPGASNGGGA